MELSELEKRITRLEDIEAIKQLKARYCDICDDLHNPDRIASVFAEDGIWEGGEFGQAKGHEAIRHLFSGFRDQFSFSQHNIMNPIIEGLKLSNNIDMILKMTVIVYDFYGNWRK